MWAIAQTARAHLASNCKYERAFGQLISCEGCAQPALTANYAAAMCGGVQSLPRQSGTFISRGRSARSAESAWMMLHFKDFRPRLKAFLPVARVAPAAPVAKAAPALDIVSQRASMAALFDDAKLALLITPPPAEPSSDVSIADWSDLISAVKDRLTLIVRDSPAASAVAAVTATELRLRDRAAWVQAGVLDCVSALDQLHSTLTHELARCRQVERDAFEARIALAREREELIGGRAAERRARHLTLRDGMSLLPTRGHFGAWLEQALSVSKGESQDVPLPESRALAVLFLDLDGFEQVHASHGPGVADELLKIVTARLSRALRPEDTVGRVNGGEFACLLFGPTDREALSQLACSLFDSVSAPVQLGRLKLRVSPSIGIAVSPDDGATCERLLTRADAAMARAKRHQTGYAFFDHQQPEA